MKTLSWKPRRYRKDGNRYCSRACGHDCMLSDYNDAVKKSKALAKRLGRGWKPDVFENIGWHYLVVNDNFEVGEHSPTHYWANLIIGRHQFHATNESPESAINDVINQIAELADELDKIYFEAALHMKIVPERKR